MALMQYRANEGVIARATAVVCTLALGILGLYQFYGFLAGVGGMDIASQDEKVSLEIVDTLVQRREAVELQKGRSYVAMRTTTFDVASGRSIEDSQLQLDLYEADGLGEVRGELSQSTYVFDGPVYKKRYLGEGPVPLSGEDISLIHQSREPSEYYEVLARPTPRSLDELESEVGGILYEAGSVTPLQDPDRRANGEFTTIKMPLRVARALRGDTFPEEGVVLATAIGEEDVEDVPALPAGETKLEDLLQYPQLLEHIVEIRHADAGVLLDAPLRFAEDGSVLGAPIYAPSLIVVSEDVKIDATEIVAEGKVLTGEDIDRLEAAELKRVLVDVERIQVRRDAERGFARAAGFTLKQPVTTSIAVGARLDAELISIVRASLGDDAAVEVANIREKLDLSDDSPEAMQSWIGKVTSARKVHLEKRTLVKCETENPADSVLTLRDYWDAIDRFNKGQPEDATWRQSMDRRELRVRDAGIPEQVLVSDPTRPDDLAGYLLDNDVVDERGTVVVKRGVVTESLEGQQIKIALTRSGRAGGGFKGWSVRTLTVQDLATYNAGPDEIFTFKAYTDQGGNTLISEGEEFTASQLLAHPRISDIQVAVEKSGKLLETVNEDSSTSLRSVAFFEQAMRRWQQIIVFDFEEVIEVQVPVTVIESEVVLDEESIIRIRELPPAERGVVVRGECGPVAVSDLTPETFEVCDPAIAIELAAGRGLDAAVIAMLEADSSVASLELEGGSQLLSLEKARELVGECELVTLAAVTSGGRVVAERGSQLDRGLLEQLRSEGVDRITVSGTKTRKLRADLEPGDVPAESRGIAITEPLEIAGDELGKNSELTEEVLAELVDLHGSEELVLPITVVSSAAGEDDAARIEVADEESWGELQRAVPTKYFMNESVSLPGPMAGTLVQLTSNYRITWAGVIDMILLAALVITLLKLLNGKKLSDLLIDTESEMRKVSWPSRDDLTGSSKVVIFTVFALAVFLLLADVVCNGVVMFVLL